MAYTVFPKDCSTPDFEAYKATGLDDIFGIEEKIAMGTWERKDIYFDYKLSNYDIKFGIPDYIGQDGFPELYYNFVIKRKFENAFIAYLLPLLLVSSLLFAELLTGSSKNEISELMGFSASGFIAACSGLFFVVMLAISNYGNSSQPPQQSIPNIFIF